MKRFLSLLLCIAILFAVPMYMAPEAEAVDKPYEFIVRYGDDDVEKSKIKNAYNFWNKVTANDRASAVESASLIDASGKKGRSKYSAKMGPLSVEGRQYFYMRDLGADIGTPDNRKYTHINYSIYSTKAVTITSSLTDSNGTAAGGNSGGWFSLKEGWNQVSLEINKEAYNGYNGKNLADINQISMIAFQGWEIPGGFTNSPTKINAQGFTAEDFFYFDAVWLSNGDGKSSFKILNIEKGQTDVLTSIGSLRFEAPCLLESSINANNVNIRYCTDCEGETPHDTHNTSGALRAGDNFTVSYETDLISINFKEDLIPGTEYKVKLTGVGFKNELASFNDYELNFRTLGEGENIKPTVSLIDLEENQRFFPLEDSPIELKAIADDVDNDIVKVEFYADDSDSPLGEGTEGEEGVYTFIWNDPESREEPYTIWAVAYDNHESPKSSESQKVSILVLDKQTPVVKITSPEDGQNFDRNVSGIQKNASVKVTAEAKCTASEPEQVKFYVDGESESIEFTDPSKPFEKTFNELEPGSHEIFVEVIDNLGVSGYSETITISIDDYGKMFPGVMEENFESCSEGEEIAWTVKGESATLNATNYLNNKVAKFAAEEITADETVSAKLRLRQNLNNSIWEAGLKLNFGDLAFERSVELFGNGSGLALTFKTDGKVYVGAEEITSYQAGEWYDVKIVVDPKAKTLNALLDGAPLFDPVTVSADYSKLGVSIIVNQNVTEGKSGYVLIDDVGVYEINRTETAIDTVTLYNGEETVSDLENVPVSTDKLEVSLKDDKALDTERLKNNVYIFDQVEQRKLPLVFEGESILLKEELKSDRSYDVIVTTNVADKDGMAIAENKKFSFTTATKDVTVAAESTFSSEPHPENDALTLVDCELDFKVNNGSPSVYLVGVVFEGNKMTDIKTKMITATSGPISIEDMEISDAENAFVEVFVVEDLANMKPVSEKIYSYTLQ